MATERSTVMLSDLRQKKLAAGFRELDVDDDGLLGTEDVDMLVRNHGDAYGFASGTPEYTELADRTLAVWEQLRQFDSDGDGRVSLAEYVAGFEAFLERREEFAAAMTALVDAFYLLADRDRTGYVSEEELVRHFRAWNHTEDQARAAFRRLDRSGRGAISKAEWMQNVDEFYYSEDPAAPGNWLAPYPRD
jgi:Ca2+-binding EF-hand superfamily protein